MKKKIFILFINIAFLSIFSFDAFADFMLLTWNQAKESDLKGWRLYYAVHADGELPEPPVSVTDYRELIELEAFDAAGTPQTPMLQINLPDGLKVYPYPEFEETYWEVTYRFYLPPYPAADNKKYYLVLTVYDFDGNESDMSNVIKFTINPPGQAGLPVSDDDL
ncbi:MAG: hypothetical protein J7K32_05835 [Deltaproteobacteria bacterium]|nr:hypothetical protein [Deltaproteobacteria bacterium]